MTVFAEIILVVSAAIVSYVLLSLHRKTTPPLFFHKLSYDPHNNKLKLTIENHGSQPVHVKPAFRLVHLKSAEEWKNGVTEDGIPMMAGREMSLIKGYELLSQLDDTVEIPPQKIQEIEVNLTKESSLQAYDNVRVSMLCGINPAKLDNVLHSTLRIRIDEASEPPTINENAIIMADGTQTKKPSIRKRVVRNGFLLEATCVCCGQVKWLKWVVDGQHVCVECRDFLYEKISGEYPQEEVELDLTVRQKKIVELIEDEGEMTLKELSKLTGKSRTTVSKEVRTLIGMGVIEQKKEKNRQIYLLA